MVLIARDYDQTRFLKAADLPGEKKFRIKSVTEEEVGIGKDRERKLVVWFTNDARGLVLNRVNNRTIRGAFGDTCESWTGKIIIAPDEPDPELDDALDDDDLDDEDLDEEAPQHDPNLPRLYAHGDPDPRPLKSWLIKHLMPEIGHGLMSGQWGAGKTFTFF